MAQILDFPDAGILTRSAVQTGAVGELVPLPNIDLETVIETLRVVRSLGRGHLLDAFNGGTAGPPWNVRPVLVEP